MRKELKTNTLESLKNRFLSHVKKTEGCWLWQKSKDKNGYGKFSIGARGSYRAHRISYILFNEADIRNLLVCHKCDNPSCVNPNHLFLGSSKQNSLDMMSKSRQASGELNGNSKLTTTQVKSIKALLGLGFKDSNIRKLHGVNKYTISDVKRGKIWAQV